VGHMTIPPWIAPDDCAPVLGAWTSAYPKFATIPAGERCGFSLTHWYVLDNHPHKTILTLR